jgi:hypothetical protein
MLKALQAFHGLSKLEKRIGKIIGEKNVDKFLNKRKGLGRSRDTKIVRYAGKKPASTLRRIARINKALDASPYVATGAAAVGTGYFLNRQDDKE